MKTSPNHLAAWVRKYTAVSETTLALTFAEHNGDKWRYNADDGTWLEWVGNHWARSHTPELLDALRNFLMVFALAFRAAQRISASEAVKLQSQRTIAAVERLCRSLPPFLARAASFDQDAFALGTPAGTVDLRTGDIRKSDPADMITVVTPVAPAPKGTPLGPRFKKFLCDITGGDADFQLTLQQLAGIGAEGTSRDQKIVFIYGDGGNGKGVFLRTLRGCLGDHAVNAPGDLLMLEKSSRHGTHKVDVINARLAICTEVDEDTTWDIALVKELTGGDPISVNRMHKDPFRITARCLLVISGNKKPALKGIDNAVKRRFIVMTFKLTVEEKDVIVDLEKQFIAEEGPAILRWMIDGAVKREAEGRLHIAKAIREDTMDYLAEENVLQDFVDTCLEVQPAGSDPEWRVKTAEVYMVWRDYCARFGRPSGAQNSFTTAIQACGVRYHRTNSGRYFVNTRMRIGWE